MIRFKAVTIQNFLSFGQKPTTVTLDIKGSMAVLGKNDDIGEQGLSGNGAGKTSFIQGVIFAMYGKGIEKLKSDDYINLVNGKKLVVELLFEKGADEYRIRRGRKPNFVELSKKEGGEWQSYTLDAMKNTDEAIVGIVGFTYDIFMASFFLSPHRQSFMAMGAADQRSMIEGMLSLDVLAERAEALKKMRSETQVELKIAMKDLDRMVEQNKLVTADIERFTKASNSFENDRKEKIHDLTTDLADIKAINIDQMLSLLEKKSAFGASLIDIDAKVKSFTLTMNDKKKEVDEYEKVEKEHASVLKKKQQFDVDQRAKLENSYRLIENNSSSVDLNARIKRIERDNETYENIRSKSKSLIDQKNRLIEQIDEAAEHFSTLMEEDKAHAVGKCHVCGGDYLDETKKARLEEKIDATQKRIKDLNHRLGDVSSELEEVLGFKQPEPTDISVVRCLKELRDDVKLAEKVVADSVVNPYNDMLESLEATKHGLVGSYAANKQLVSELKEEVKNLTEFMNQIRYDLKDVTAVLDASGISDIRDIDLIEKAIIDIEQKIKEAQEAPNIHAGEVEILSGRLVSLDEFEGVVEALRERETHIGYLIKLMTDSKSFIRRKILDNYIPYLNKKIIEATEQLGLGHICEVNSDLSVDITYMSRPVSYFNMSRGERMRLDMAVTVAFRKMMELLGKGCNLMLIDEALDGSLDAYGAQAAKNFMKKSSESVFIVTHREDIAASLDSRMVVTKHNGFTSIEMM